MKINLFQVSSYYILILILPMFFWVQYLRNNILSTTSRTYTNYKTKSYLISILISLNFMILMIRVLIGGYKTIDPTYYVLQIIALSQLLLQNVREKNLGLRSPAYTFLLYFITNVGFLVGCNVHVIAFGEYCQTQTCETAKEGELCSSCSIMPMVAREIRIVESGQIVRHYINENVQIIFWLYADLVVVFSVIGIINELKSKKISRNRRFVDNSPQDQIELI
jgi:hypothetical protein